MTLNLVADQYNNGKPYPALALPHITDFDNTWPYTIPLRLIEYCRFHNVPVNFYTVNDFPACSFYPIAFGFFDFSIDYLALLPQEIFNRVKSGLLKILFYYHEGDNPIHIKNRLENLISNHNFKKNCYVFVSGNSAAKHIQNFLYFADFELWYYHRNVNTSALTIHHLPRKKDFTALNRLHKSWRSLIMSDLKYYGILENSYWSYCQSGEFIQSECPIQASAFPEIKPTINDFLQKTPNFSDMLTDYQRNDPSITEEKYFTDSYCNIVLETHFDADRSNGAFLSEKTFKPIKHGQIFFIAGTAGSLQILRNLGYSVFDHVLDNRYDCEHDHTQRYIKLSRAIFEASQNPKDLFERARLDVNHNQQLFVSSKVQRLNNLIEEINDHY